MSLEAQRLEQIKKIILEHKGKAHPISAREIGKMLNIPENDTVATTRKLITKLILDERMPIGAYKRGYFYIESQKELAEYMEHLQERIRKTTTRLIMVHSNYEGKYGKAKIKKLEDF